MLRFKEVTCNNCGWVHFQVSRRYAEEEVRKFNDYFYKQTPEVQGHFGGKPSSVSHYEKCKRCGGDYKNFRDGVEGDSPIGCTLNPVINRKE